MRARSRTLCSTPPPSLSGIAWRQPQTTHRISNTAPTAARLSHRTMCAAPWRTSAEGSFLPESGSVALATPRSTDARRTALQTASEAPIGTLPRQVLDNTAYHPLLRGRRLDELERRPIGAHECFILGNVFRDLGLAIGPVVEAREIPD